MIVFKFTSELLAADNYNYEAIIAVNPHLSAITQLINVKPPQSVKSHIMNQSSPERLPSFCQDKSRFCFFTRVQHNNRPKRAAPPLTQAESGAPSGSFLAHRARSLSVSHLCRCDATAAAQRGSLSCPSALSFFFISIVGYILRIKPQWYSIQIKNISLLIAASNPGLITLLEI